MFLKIVSLATTFFALMLPPARSADFPTDLERWYVTVPPERGSEQSHVAHLDVKHQWVVSPGKEGPRVGLWTPEQEGIAPLPFEIKSDSAKEGLSGRRTATKVPDGWIVGFDAGEFGAGLWWFSPDGKRRYKISDDHVLTFVSTSSGLFAVVGLEHGTTSYGGAVRLSRDRDGNWLTEPLVDFGEAPQAVVKDDNSSMLVATSKRLLRFDPASKKLHVLLGKAFWDGLYPNSIVVASSGTVYVGMRHGVAKIEKKGRSYEVLWLLPNKGMEDEKLEEVFK